MDRFYDMDLFSLDATAIAHIIRTKQQSIYQIVSHMIEHAKNENAYIHAIVEDRFEEALDEAKEKDAILQSSTDVGPLFGVPISVKESFDVKGMKTTGGLLHLKNHVATTDADVIQALKQAGAIILCKTNTPTLCFCQETDNKLYGKTNNAWDQSKTAGGSSGGEAALLAVGGATVGIGSDIGGSIRFPCHFNGIIGFKPGKSQVSLQGHFPNESIALQQRMSTAGPMGKSVRDMKLMYETITRTPTLKQDIKDLSVSFLPLDQPYPLNESTNQWIQQVEQFASSVGHVERDMPPYFLDSATVWQEIMSIDGAADMKKIAFPKGKLSYIRSYIWEKLSGKSSVHRYLSWALIGATLFKPSQKRVEELVSYFSQGDEEVYAYYEDRVSVLPVYHSSAFAHGDVYNEIFSIKKTYQQVMPFVAYANVWGLPSLTVPIGIDEENMPIGVQIVSRVGNEDLIFQVGKLIEREFHGYVRSTSSTRA